MWDARAEATQLNHNLQNVAPGEPSHFGSLVRANGEESLLVLAVQAVAQAALRRRGTARTARENASTDMPIMEADE